LSLIRYIYDRMTVIITNESDSPEGSNYMQAQLLSGDNIYKLTFYATMLKLA